MPNMSNEVTDLLTALHEGTLSLSEVAERFRIRSWPTRTTVRPKNHLDLAEADLGTKERVLPIGEAAGLAAARLSRAVVTLS